MLSTLRRLLNKFHQGVLSASTSEAVSPASASLSFERLEDRILLTILGVPANSQGVWTFLDADDDQIRLVITTGPSSGAIVDIYDQNGAHMDFDSIPGGPFGGAVLFAGPTNFASSGVAGPAPASVAVGDMDGDNNVDLIVANSGNDMITLFFGTGTGTFGLPVDYSLAGLGSAGINPTAVAVGYFDSDTDLDVAVTTLDPTPGRTNDFVTVLSNNGAGVLTWVADNDVGILPSSLAVADFNSDGTLDLAVANASVLDPLNDPYTFSVLLAAGGGAFGPAVYYTAGTAPSSIYAADFDHDGPGGIGDADIAVANRGDDTVSVFLNILGTGAFTENILGGSPFSVGLAGQTDMPVFITGAQTNDDAGPDPGDGFAPDGVIDDGEWDHLDLIVVNQLGDNVTVLEGDGNGSFSIGQTIALSPNSRPSAVAVGLFDLEGEEFLDLAVTNEARGNVSIFLGQGGEAGGFVAAANRDYNADTGPAWIAAGDFNPTGTGDLHDLVTANTAAGTLSVLIATGAQEGPDDVNHLDIGYIDIQSSGADTNIVINEYSFTDDTDAGNRELTLTQFSGDNTPGDGSEANFADLPHFAQPSVWPDPSSFWVAPPGGAVWVRGDIYTSGADQDMGRILIGGCFGLDDIHGNNAAGQPGAADGIAGDNGSIRITGSCAGIAVGFLAGSIDVSRDLDYVTVEDNAGFIARISGDANPYQDEGPTFRNSRANIGWDLGFAESGRSGGGHWRTPISVTGIAYPEAVLYTDAGAGSNILAAAPVRNTLENFFQIAGTHATGDGVDYFRMALTAGENIHVFASRGEMVRLFDTLGVQIPAPSITSGGYFSSTHGNYIVPATGVYYLAVSWTEDDANMDGLDDTTFQNGPVDADPYDVFVGISSEIYYEQEVIQGETYDVPPGFDMEPLVPNTRGYLVTSELANDTVADAEFVPLANGTVTIHGVFGVDEDLDWDGTVDLTDGIDVYRIAVEAGTRIIAGVNGDILDPLYSPSPLEDSGFWYPSIGLLDEEGNVLASSWLLEAGVPGRGSNTDGHIDYLVPEAGIYYIAAVMDDGDFFFDGDPMRWAGTGDVHYEIFVTGTSTRQTMAGLDTNAGILGPGPFADNVRGNIDLANHDIGVLLIGTELQAVDLNVRAGDLVYMNVPIIGNADELELAWEFISDPEFVISDYLHRVDTANFERGMFAVGIDAFQFMVSGDWGGDNTDGWYCAALFAADDIGIVDVTGTFWGNLDVIPAPPAVVPNLVVDYDLLNTVGDTGTIDYIHVGAWGTLSQPAVVVTAPGGNVRFVDVTTEGSVFRLDIPSLSRQGIPLTIFNETTWDTVTFRDDSGSTLYISVDGDGPAPPVDPDAPAPDEDAPVNAPPASGSYQRVPIHGTNTPFVPTVLFNAGTLEPRFIGWAIDDLTIVAPDDGIPQVALFGNGQIDIATLDLVGVIDFSSFARSNGGEIYYREITATGGPMSFFGRTDVVGLTAGTLDYLRIYDGNLGWTPAATNDGTCLTGWQFTGYRPGSFTGPWIVVDYTPTGSPDLVINGLQLSGSVGEITVSRTILDVEVSGSVGGIAFFETGVTHQITANSDHRHAVDPITGLEVPFLTGKPFEGIAGTIYAGISIGKQGPGSFQEMRVWINEPTGGIYLGDGLPHSGSGANPRTGIFLPYAAGTGGDVSRIFCDGPSKTVSGDIFVGYLGLDQQALTDLVDFGFLEEGEQVPDDIGGGLVLTNGARIYDLQLMGTSDFTLTYDAGSWIDNTIVVITDGELYGLTVRGNQARVDGLLAYYTRMEFVTIEGFGVRDSSICGVSGRYFNVRGDAAIVSNVRSTWSTLESVTVSGFGITDCWIAVSYHISSIRTTDPLRGNCVNTQFAVAGDFFNFSIAHDVINCGVTSGDRMKAVLVGHDINGLTLSSAGMDVVQTGNDMLGVDYNFSGEVKRIQAVNGRIAGTRITGFGPWATIGSIIARGNIDVLNITSWGTIKLIKSETGTITGTITTLGPNAMIQKIQVAGNLNFGVNLVLTGPLNNLVVKNGNLTGFINVGGRIGTINVVNGSIAAAATITSGGSINAIMARGNIGGPGHFITAAGRIGKVESRNGFINSTITSNDTSNRAVNLVQAGGGAISGAVTANFGGIGRVFARNGAVNAVVTSARGIEGVESRNGNITGAITANGGNITKVRATNGNIAATAVITALAGRVIDVQGNVIGGVGHTIFASDRISTVKSTAGNVTSTITSNSTANNAINRVEARNGDVNGAVNAAFGGINNVQASWNRATGTGGNINATVTAAGEVNRVQTEGQAGNAATGNITGAITSTTSRIGTVKANKGNVAATATVTAATDVTRVEGDAIGGVGHTITAGGRVKNIQSKAGAITTTVTAGAAHNSAIGDVKGKGGAVNATLNAAAGGVGNVQGDSLAVIINANRRVGNLQSTNGNIVGTVTSATDRIGTIQSRNGNISGVYNAATQIGTIKATFGSITGANFTAGTIISGLQTTGTGDITGVNARAGTRIGTVKSNRDILNTQISARTQLASVRVMRDAITCLFASGYDFGGDNLVGTADDWLQTGRTGSVNITGNAQDVNIVAGVGPGADAIFGNGNDVGAGGTGRMGTVRAGTFITTGPSFGVEADNGSFVMRDGAGNRVTATAAAQVFPGTTYNVQIL